jgi:NAD(P)-dependent dehydrogenase (short-subunit alcohol dehydrogenase family)
MASASAAAATAHPARQVAAITGGARGIGLGYARTLLATQPCGGGWAVALLDVSGAAAAAAALCTEYGPTAALGVVCDVADPGSFRSALEAVRQHAAAALGGAPLTLLVLNAGVFEGSLFAGAGRTLAVNLGGTITGAELAVHAATGGLAHPASPRLDIICTSSSNGLVPADSDCAPVYCATKAGVLGFVRALAFLGPRYNVRVNAVCPVTVDTPMAAPSLTPEVRGFLDREGRGGVLPADACAAVAVRTILGNPDPALSGRVYTVHPVVLTSAETGREVPLNPGGVLSHLGAWRADESAEVSAALDGALTAVAAGQAPGWSAAVAPTATAAHPAHTAAPLPVDAST